LRYKHCKNERDRNGRNRLPVIIDTSADDRFDCDAGNVDLFGEFPDSLMRIFVRVRIDVRADRTRGTEQWDHHWNNINHTH